MTTRAAEALRRRLLFRDGQRLRITNHGSFPDMNGITGVVVRVCSRGDSAWIRTDKPLEDRRRSFRPPDERQDHTKVYFDEVEEIGPACF
ncbi:MAG: hypothetical protein WC829_02800 [Hyphomicrobium sp.]|jgi:hypothetical protein